MKALVLAAIALSSVAMAGGEYPLVKVNGKPVEFKGTQPHAIVGRVMVPVRGVFEAIGAYVEYNPVNHRVTARRANEEIDLGLGDKLAHRNGAEIELDVAPLTIEGRMMVPLRFIAESLGATVDYVKDTRTVEITTNENIPGVKQPPR